MTPERWKKIEEIYHAVLEKDPRERESFLEQAAAGDVILRRQVQSLLAETQDTSNFMERPALHVEAESMAHSRTEHMDAHASPRLQLPSLGARYVVLSEAGSGGMGIVYRVRDQETDEIVALKVLHPNIASDEQMIHRFKTELRLARKVTHRNVCRIYEINKHADTTYISMEFVDGESLRRALNRLGALTLRKGAEVVRQICEGLREAHSQGIIHGDLKPENVMLNEAGNVKIMDFGVARLSSGGSTITLGAAGTPSYMSPEQAEGKHVDQRSDIYSLGLLMYEILTGRIAFSGETPIEIALKQVRETPPDPRSLEPFLSPELAGVIMHCIEKDPAIRFQTVDEVLAALPGSSCSGSSPKVAIPKNSTWFSETAYILEPRRARIVLLTIQSGYLALYCTTLLYIERAGQVLETELQVPLSLGIPLLVLSALAGIAARIYLISALAFDHPDTGRQFWRLFPALLLLDALWAGSPLLLANRIGVGAALACAAGLAYLPFSQKTLITNAYR